MFELLVRWYSVISSMILTSTEAKHLGGHPESVLQQACPLRLWSTSFEDCCWNGKGRIQKRGSPAPGLLLTSHVNFCSRGGSRGGQAVESSRARVLGAPLLTPSSCRSFLTVSEPRFPACKIGMMMRRMRRMVMVTMTGCS